MLGLRRLASLPVWLIQPAQGGRANPPGGSLSRLHNLDNEFSDGFGQRIIAIPQSKFRESKLVSMFPIDAAGAA